jgi:ribosomal protein L3 glutamine methyltransferase
MTTETIMSDDPETVGGALQYCVNALENSDVFYGHGTDNAWDEALQLVLSVSQLPLDSSDDVLPHTLSSVECQQLKLLLERRIAEHIPLPYLLGRAWFAGLEFTCDERAIIPRSPIAELILNEFKPWYQGAEPKRILDLCCGGGCIGLAAAYHFPQLSVDLADLDEQALQLAKENTSRLGLAERVSLIHSNLFEAVEPVKYDIILSNPPYVNASDLATMPTEYHHEPELALGSGPDGLALTRQILQFAGSYLSEDGLLVVEVGNSWPDLEKLYPKVPFTWLEFASGGHGVFALSAKELQQFSASFMG